MGGCSWGSKQAQALTPPVPSFPQAALLHDTVEDTDTTFPEIEERFGEEVRHLVEEVTDDKTLPKAERKRLQIEHAARGSRGARLLKLADKLYNLQDLNRCTPQGLSVAHTHQGEVGGRRNLAQLP